jgi:hypothetical protein
VYVDNRVFPMDIPSTSWYNDRFDIKMASQKHVLHFLLTCQCVDN